MPGGNSDLADGGYQAIGGFDFHGDRRQPLDAALALRILRPGQEGVPVRAADVRTYRPPRASRLTRPFRFRAKPELRSYAIADFPFRNASGRQEPRPASIARH